jgi:hypothetical protein
MDQILIGKDKLFINLSLWMILSFKKSYDVRFEIVSFFFLKFINSLTETFNICSRGLQEHPKIYVYF